MQGNYSRTIVLVKRVFVTAICLTISVFFNNQFTFAQTNSNQSNVHAQIQQHLNAGEFPVAIQLADTLAGSARDEALAEISNSQFDSGASSGAYETAGTVSGDTSRAELLTELSGKRVGSNAGQAGGITAADFTNLIDLITNTVQPDSWQDTGQGLGTIQSYPAGVFVDGTGTLKKIKVGNNDMADRIRERGREGSGNRDWMWKSDLRMISITRLEKAAQLLAARGKPVSETMRNLGGMYQVKYLMMYPETGDIVIAGPAGPWKLNQDNRPVNVETGKPVLQLDDLVVCLRNAWDNNGKFGCSITPRKQNLADTKQFLATTSLKGKRWSKEIRSVLGKQDIEVFGIDPGTHAARVLVEADYRMKLLGMGLEESIPEVPSYFDRVKLGANGQVPPMDVVRWWFTLNYDDIVSNDARTTFTFNGTGVKVLSETEFISDQGDRIHTGTSHGPTKGFARDFTKHFDKLADEYPVYRQLKNVFDMALVANLIRNQEMSAKTKWHRTFFATPDSDQSLAYRVRMDRTATQVDSVLNEKILKVRKQKSTVKHHMVGVSGGISCNVHDILEAKFSDDSNGELAKSQKLATPDAEEIKWWWD